MNQDFRGILKKEISLYYQKQNDHQAVVHHLGRAHILSQNSFAWHLYVHFIMLGYAFRIRDPKEIIGQFIRLIVVIPGHMIGNIPFGNPGWSYVKLTKKFPIPEDLKTYLN